MCFSNMYSICLLINALEDQLDIYICCLFKAKPDKSPSAAQAFELCFCRVVVLQFQVGKYTCSCKNEIFLTVSEIWIAGIQ